ncbi:erythrocyte membrane protein 1 [Plasmodium falciparum RAJ116]|uniref:Erythrocyte membrane protein 1 n=1 Tax=Plasmodium falciparum RAJ116 TaxID=580058 RepID=A0A0L0CVD7_PLAFA|nr:erythrocyte membrane protein 1 [Plasmodium falciparum RAJ116]
MGSSASKFSKTVVGNETHKSARNVLENLAKDIKRKASNNAKRHENVLKANLRQAKFHHEFFKINNYIPKNPCNLDFAFHSNTPGGEKQYRHPCARSMNKNLFNLEGAVCTNSKIKGNEEKINGAGACAPYRRRHICNYNLEYINENNTKTTHDLLGNVLVTAKYEGASIVEKHPNRGSSEVCTALARSFADIGDIVRGTDLFLGGPSQEKKKLEENLKKIFENIKNKNTKLSTLTLEKVREYWWALNRNDVWKALTCSAPYEAQYFIKSSDKEHSFSSEYCGHYKNGDPLTNLDYVPQFLRWFEEWAEEFCRIKKIKLENVEKACRDEPNEKYCSGDGHDCTKTDLSRNSIFVDLNCPDCEKACENYTKWIEIQRKQFDKQKRKYMNEIDMNTYTSNNENDKEFYENLDKKGYSTINTFLELLNNVKQCKGNNNIKNEMNFKNPNKAFGPSEYCDPCPIYGVNCTKGKCIPVKEEEWVIKNGLPKDTSTKNMSPTQIDVLVNHGIGNSIDNELEKNCTKYGILKGIKKQKWQCQYLNNIDQCKINNVVNSPYFDNKIGFNVLFQRWLRYFVKDYNKMREKLNPCIKKENGKENICIKGCKANCECVGKWLEKKYEEWEKIKEHYNKNKSHYGNAIPYWITGFYEKVTFPSDFFKALEGVDTINGLEKLKKCQDNTCKIKEISTIDVDFINKLISWLQNKIEVCKSHHDEDNHERCCDKLPKIADGEDEDDEDDDEEDVSVTSGEKQNVKQDCAGKKSDEVCEMVKALIGSNNGINGGIDSCNPKTGTYPSWKCDKNSGLVDEDGVCMPPRRQKLCVSALTQQGSLTKIEDIRTHFINCASIETHFAWHRYKKDNGNAENELKAGNIPEGFKKQMFYTFGDYRSIFFGTDISSCPNIKKASENIKRILKKEADEEKNEKQMLDEWTNSYGPEIWEGMLCALTHEIGDEKKNLIKTAYSYDQLKKTTNDTPSLDEFSSRPQFLRWFIEWGEEFCRERDTLEKNVEESCKDAQCNIDGTRTNKTECENACKNYTTYIKDKKSEYNEQKSKFDAEKIKGNGLYIDLVMKKSSHISSHVSDDVSNDVSSKLASEPMSCVEMSAKEIRKAAQKNIERKLKGKGNMYNGKCKNLDKKEYMTENGGKCKFNEGMRSTYKSIIQECDTSEKKRFDIKEYWDCSAKTSGNKNTLCIPPRRKYMCLKKLENIKAHDIKSSDELLKEIQEVAKSEGDDIIEKLLPYNACNENVICSAMKYSFADLGDVIRGRDLWIRGRSHNRIESKLKLIFDNIFNNMEPQEKYKYKDRVNYYELRSAWWDANRTKVWNAMTCNAPTDAALVKKETTNTTDSLIKKYEVSKKCNYNSDPPDDDYIPQPFRWLQEWSEHFCRVQKDKLDKLKTACGECDQNKTDLACMINSNSNDNKCIKCKNACNDYRNMIDGWNRQWKKQQETYKELYTFKNGVDIHKINVKEFLDKMIEKCDTNMENSNDFLSRASHCTNLTFDKTKNKNNIPYAFQHPPDKYNVLCGTMYRKSCQKLKRLESNNVCEKKYNLIRESSTWQKLPNEFIYVPPRTQQLCLEPLQALISSTKKTTKVTEYDFSKTLQICAYNEAKFLHNYYSKDGKDLVFSGDVSEATEDEIKKHILECMKRSFADYGDLIKGTTKYDYNGTKLNILDLIKKVGYNDKSPETLEYVWNIHKSDLWHAMICGYNACNPNKLLHEEEVMCKLPDNDSQDEFLRWFTEWTEDFCMYKKTKMKYFKNNCTFNSCDLANSKEIHKCLETCQKYKNWIEEKKIEYTNQKKKYNKKYKKSIEDKNDANEFLKNTCEGKCKCITEKANSNNMDNVFEEYPEGFKTKCECYPEQCRGLSVTDSYIPDGSPFGGGQSLNECRLLQGTHNKCPTEEICNIYNKKTKRCHVKTYDDYFSNWDSRGMLNTSSENEGVLVPPRRRHICLRISTEHFRQLKKKPEVFERLIYSSATNEAQGLIKKYGNDNNKLLQAIKYSFADIGNVVKGDDMMESPTSEYIGKVLGDENGSNDKRIRWWNIHKKNVWDAMLCAYKKATSNEISDPQWCSLPKEDETPQFLRWFQEWTENFCSRRNKLYSTLEDKCKSVNCNTKNGKIESYECKRACQAYENYIFSKQLEYHIQNKQYKTNFKESQDNKDITEYFKDASNGKCNCLSDNFNEEVKWEKPYETLDGTLKDICDCKYIPSTPVEPGNAEVPVTPSQNDQSDLLNSTIPLGIGFALGSIALLFYMKKKPKSPVDLLRVIDIPKSDYDIPTKLSPNRYIPYTSGKYRGKRYIYLEGDSGTDSGYTDHYSDITSSSESEYEELDINDIYVPGSPKYKTLIEVVLEPSKKDIPSDDIPHSNKFTDEEWNQLKHDFISQYLQSEQPNDVPNDYTSGNSSTNTNITTPSRDNMEEKPFITSIHDRNLYTGEEISYNVNMSTNSMDDIPINRDNNVYSGIDLINDTLSGDYDIYDEVLKRKENELFGTNHVKQTSIHSVAKLTNSDPIHNQLNLFHKWLDRHRDMCEKLKNHHERLAKLKEKWENETHSGNTHPSDSNKTLNTDVSIQIHMDNPKTTNEFTYVDSNPNQVDDTYVDSNPDNSSMDTILEDLDKYNEPYYDVQDDIYYDVNDHDTSTVDTNAMDVPSKVQIEMDVNTKLVKEKYPIADVWDI